MKLNNFVWLCAVAFAFSLWSCSSETVSPKADQGNQAPALQADGAAHPDVAPVCSDRVSYDLIDETGSEFVTYCPFGCTGSEPRWGDVEILNSDSAIYFNYTLAFGWYVESATTFIGDETTITSVNGIPSVDPTWVNSTVDPIVNLHQERVDFAGLPQCFDFSAKISVVQLDFFTGVKEASRSTLWIKNSDWNNPQRADLNTTSPFIGSWCIAACGPTITSVAGGDCEVCDAAVSVNFLNCASVDISSCKDLSNVVLVYTDCEWEKFDGLSSTSGTFSGTGTNAGKDISHVYVKSGCYKSGEGPGFGRRFDGPCVNNSCAPISNGNGGGKNK